MTSIRIGCLAGFAALTALLAPSTASAYTYYCTLPGGTPRSNDYCLNGGAYRLNTGLQWLTQSGTIYRTKNKVMKVSLGTRVVCNGYLNSSGGGLAMWDCLSGTRTIYDSPYPAYGVCNKASAEPNITMWCYTEF